MKTTKTIKSGEHQTTIKRMDWTIRVYSCETHRHATRRAWHDGLNTYVQYNSSFWMVATTDRDNTLVVEYAEVTETTEPETTEAEAPKAGTDGLERESERLSAAITAGLVYVIVATTCDMQGASYLQADVAEQLTITETIAVTAETRHDYDMWMLAYAADHAEATIEQLSTEQALDLVSDTYELVSMRYAYAEHIEQLGLADIQAVEQVATEEQPTITIGTEAIDQLWDAINTNGGESSHDMVLAYEASLNRACARIAGLDALGIVTILGTDDLYGLRGDAREAVIAARNILAICGADESAAEQAVRELVAEKAAQAGTIAIAAPEATTENEAEAIEATTQQVAADAARQPTKSVKAPTTDEEEHWRKVGVLTAEGCITTFATMDEAADWVGHFIDGEMDGFDDETSHYDFDLHAIAEAVTCERCFMLALLPIYDEASDQFEYATLWQVIESHRIGGDDPTDPTDEATDADATDEANADERPTELTKAIAATIGGTADHGQVGLWLDASDRNAISAWERCAFDLAVVASDGYDGEVADETVANARRLYDVVATLWSATEPASALYDELHDEVREMADWLDAIETLESDGEELTTENVIKAMRGDDDEPTDPDDGTDATVADEGTDYEAEWRAKHPYTTTATVWVTSYGAMCAMPARSLPVGIVTVCTGGATETIVDKAVSKSGKTVTLTVRGEGGTVSTRRRNAETMVAVRGHRINRSVWHIDWPTEADEDANGPDASMVVACEARTPRATAEAPSAADCGESGDEAVVVHDEPTATVHASDRVNVATRIMALWDEFEPYTYRDALLEEGGDACALRAAIAADPDQLRGLLDEVMDEGTTEQATRALAIIDAIDRLDAATIDEPYAPIGWLDHDGETLDVWATTERDTYRVTAELDRLDVLDTIHADSDEQAVASAAEAFGACGFLAIDGEQMAYLTNADFDGRIITHDEMAEAWHSLRLDGASTLRVQLMRNSVVYFMAQLRDSASDEATRERYRVTTSAVTCALDCLAHAAGRDGGESAMPTIRLTGRTIDGPRRIGTAIASGRPYDVPTDERGTVTLDGVDYERTVFERRVWRNTRPHRLLARFVIIGGVSYEVA